MNHWSLLTNIIFNNMLTFYAIKIKSNKYLELSTWGKKLNLLVCAESFRQKVLAISYILYWGNVGIMKSIRSFFFSHGQIFNTLNLNNKNHIHDKKIISLYNVYKGSLKQGCNYFHFQWDDCHPLLHAFTINTAVKKQHHFICFLFQTHHTNKIKH